MVWWGLGLAAIATSGWGVWPVLFGPLLLNLLLRWVSGVRMSEVDLERPGFAEWVATTPRCSHGRARDLMDRHGTESTFLPLWSHLAEAARREDQRR